MRYKTKKKLEEKKIKNVIGLHRKNILGTRDSEVKMHMAFEESSIFFFFYSSLVVIIRNKRAKFVILYMPRSNYSHTLFYVFFNKKK